MQIGAMNHPREDPASEIRWIAKMGFDFIDLTLEPPQAASTRADVARLQQALAESGLRIVGHTAYYLPLASAFEPVRRAAVEELCRCLEVFARLGARWMNVHPDGHAPMHPRSFLIERNLESLREVNQAAQRLGMGLMIENLPGSFNTVAQLGELLDPMPELGLHLDIGHANLTPGENTAPAILAVYAGRVRHVHLHDNKGGSADLHLPLGAGTLDVAQQVGALKRSGYDGTITLEVFTPDRHYLAYSRDRLRQLWDADPS